MCFCAPVNDFKPHLVSGVVYGSSLHEALLWKETSCRAPEQEVLYCDTLLEIFYYLDQHWSWLFLYQHTIQSIFALSFFQSIMSDSRTLRALIETSASHLTVTIRHEIHIQQKLSTMTIFALPQCQRQQKRSQNEQQALRDNTGPH